MLHRFFVAAGFALCCAVPAIPAAAAGTSSPWLDVPFVQQQKDGCGAASIAMVMQYWQQQRGQTPSANAGYAHIQEALLSRSAHGIFASAMARYFQQNGFSAFTFTGDVDLLEHHLAQGRPLVVALKPATLKPAALDPSSQSTFHYVVVAGVDRPAGVVLVNDPAGRKLLKQDLARFEQEWKAAGNWTLLAVPEPDAR